MCTDIVIDIKTNNSSSTQPIPYTVQVDPRWKLVYVGNENSYSCTNLVRRCVGSVPELKFCPFQHCRCILKFGEGCFSLVELRSDQILHKKLSTGLSNMSTIQIKYCDIPAYLHAGDFYRNLDIGDPESIIEIPAANFHADGKQAFDLEEFRQVLRVMVFWALVEFPVAILDFCNVHEIDVWEKGIADLHGAAEAEVRPFLSTAYGDKGSIPFGNIIKTGRWDLIKHAVGRIGKRSIATATAALHGNLRLLKYLHEQRFAWHEDTCRAASQNGHLTCLQFAHENGYSWDSNVYIQAAAFGHLSCMQYGHVQGLQEWHTDVCKFAALNGHLECLRFAHENGCPCNDLTTFLSG